MSEPSPQVRESAAGPPPPGAGPSDAAARERARSRLVIALTSALTVLVIGTVVLLGLQARHGAAATRSAYGARDVWGDPYRSTPWPTEGCEPDRENPPHMVLDLPPEGLDFGTVKQGVRLEQDVRFHNTGPGRLCVRDVTSGCGCIKASLLGEPRRFEPGESGIVRVSLDTAGRDGPQKKGISIFTNSLDQPVQTFTVQALIARGLIAQPSHLVFPTTTRGRTSETTLRLRSPLEDADWTVTSVAGEALLDGTRVPYTFRLVPLEDPERRVLDVVIRHPGAPKEGLYRDEITVTTTHPDRPAVRVATDLSVVPPVVAIPPRAILGHVPSPSVARIRLDPGAPGDTFDVEGVELVMADGSNVPRGGTGFVAEPRRDEEGRWWVDVRYDGKLRDSGQLRATLIVRTTHPDMRALEIPCLATIPASPR